MVIPADDVEQVINTIRHTATQLEENTLENNVDHSARFGLTGVEIIEACDTVPEDIVRSVVEQYHANTIDSTTGKYQKETKAELLQKQIISLYNLIQRDWNGTEFFGKADKFIVRAHSGRNHLSLSVHKNKGKNPLDPYKLNKNQILRIEVSDNVTEVPDELKPKAREVETEYSPLITTGAFSIIGKTLTFFGNDNARNNIYNQRDLAKKITEYESRKPPVFVDNPKVKIWWNEDIPNIDTTSFGGSYELFNALFLNYDRNKKKVTETLGVLEALPKVVRKDYLRTEKIF